MADLRAVALGGDARPASAPLPPPPCTSGAPLPPPPPTPPATGMVTPPSSPQPVRAQSARRPGTMEGGSTLRRAASVTLRRLPLTPHGTPGRGPTPVPTPPRTPPPGMHIQGNAWELPGPPPVGDIIRIPSARGLTKEQLAVSTPGTPRIALRTVPPPSLAEAAAAAARQRTPEPVFSTPSTAPSTVPNTARLRTQGVWAVLLGGRVHLKVAEVQKACERFRTLRGSAEGDKMLTLQDFAAMLDKPADTSGLAELFELLASDGSSDPAEAGPKKCDLRVLLVVMAGLTKAKPVDRMRFAGLLLDSESTGQLTYEQLTVILRANAILNTSTAPPKEVELQNLARALIRTATGQVMGTTTLRASTITFPQYLKLVEDRPEDFFLAPKQEKTPELAATAPLPEAQPAPAHAPALAPLEEEVKVPEPVPIAEPVPQPEPVPKAEPVPEAISQDSEAVPAPSTPEGFQPKVPDYEELPEPEHIILPHVHKIWDPEPMDMDFLNRGVKKMLDYVPPEPPLFLPPPFPLDSEVPPLPQDALLSPQPTPEGTPRDDLSEPSGPPEPLSPPAPEPPAPLPRPRGAGPLVRQEFTIRPYNKDFRPLPKPAIPRLDMDQVNLFIDEHEQEASKRFLQNTGSTVVSRFVQEENMFGDEDDDDGIAFAEEDEKDTVSVHSIPAPEHPSSVEAGKPHRRSPAVMTDGGEAEMREIGTQAGTSFVHEIPRLSDMTHGQYVREQQKDILVKATTWHGPMRGGQKALCLTAAVLIQFCLFLFALDTAGISTQSTNVDPGHEARSVLGIASGAGGVVTLCYCMFVRHGCSVPSPPEHEFREEEEHDIESALGRRLSP